MENKMRRHLSRRLTLLEGLNAQGKKIATYVVSPHIDLAGEIHFPDAQQTEDYREIDDANVAESLGEDLMATLNRRAVSNRAIQSHIVERLRDWLEVRTCAESNGEPND